MTVLSELGQWILDRWANTSKTTADQQQISRAPGEAHYKVRLKRSPSMFTTPSGVTYIDEDNIIGKGRGGMVRELKPIQLKDGEPAIEFVVKRNLNKQQKPTDLVRAADFIRTAYPELAPHVHVFNPDNGGDARLVMPKMGEVTLGSILRDNGRTLNNRYAYYIKALQALIDLRQSGIRHNDAHTENILFDKSGQCFLIDGERFQRASPQAYYSYDVDFLKFKNDNLHNLIMQYGSLNWESIFRDKEYMPRTLYLKFDEKKKVIEYHVLNLQGTLVKGEITLQDCQKMLTHEAFEKINTEIFNSDDLLDVAGRLEHMLPIILEITSQREETTGGINTYFSSQFLKDLNACTNLEAIKGTVIQEMKLNHEITVNLIKRLNTLLNKSIDKALDIKSIRPEVKDLLDRLKQQVATINCDDASSIFNEQNTSNPSDEALSKLLHGFYQLEHLVYSNKDKHTLSFILRKSSELCQAIDPFLNIIRDELRYYQPHLPELLVSRNKVIEAYGISNKSKSSAETTSRWKSAIRHVSTPSSTPAPTKSIDGVENDNTEDFKPPGKSHT
jgi:hypothetical protein